MLQITPQRCGTSDEIVKLWAHEMCRVFRDRLVDATDRGRFNEMVKRGLEQHLERDWPVGEFDELTYGAFMAADADVRVYEPIELSTVQAKFDEYLVDYNMSSTKPMNLVFFKDACMHALRIARVLRAPRGNALLVGVGGSGRQSLTRLAAAIWEMEFMSIEITRTYDQVAFRDDLKKMLMRSGGALGGGGASAESCQTVFYFSDTQIVRESFLEDINNVLNSGEVPNLFELDEMERIIASARPLAVAAGKVETRDAIYQHFVQLVRENLHIVICMSPIGDAFRVRCRMFPSLINCCTIDWFNEWPQEALLSVAQHQFHNVDLGTAEIKAGVCNVCVAIHYDVSKSTARFYDELRRITYTTPTSYLELLTLFLSTLAEQRERIAQQISRYRGGVDKLVATNRVVDSMKAELTEMQPVLAHAQKDTAKLLEEVSRDQQAADAVKEQTAKEEAAVTEIANEAQAIAADAQRDLDEVRFCVPRPAPRASACPLRTSAPMSRRCVRRVRRALTACPFPAAPPWVPNLSLPHAPSPPCFSPTPLRFAPAPPSLAGDASVPLGGRRAEVPRQEGHPGGQVVRKASRAGADGDGGRLHPARRQA
jgi:dynein heavy chain